MDRSPHRAARELEIGTMPREVLTTALHDAGVLLNPHAETLLAHPAFETPDPRTIQVTLCTVGELGLSAGGSLPQVFAAAVAQDLALCPLVTGPYLRLALREQPNAPDSVLSAGRAPTGAVHVASAPVSEDVEVPKGFYLRVVDDQSWLRGYRCDDDYVWTPDVRLAFCLPA